jgi:hypothetical protein
LVLPLAVLLLILPAGNLFAGFNDIMDQILAQEELTYGSAAWLVLTGTGVLSDEASIDDAVMEMGQRVPKIAADRDRIITLGEFSLLVMKGWEIKGGLFYSLIPSPRYALRELRFLEIVQGRAYCRMKITGERAVRILGRVVSWKEVQ